MELYARLSSTTMVAFLDLKSAFDVANREIILDQLVELRWIRGYLRSRTSRVLFKDAYSSSKEFELGTTQGGVLSLFIFNVLIHRLLSLLPDIPGTTVICYADDICVHSNSPEDLQRFLQSFCVSSSTCGLILSPEKKVESFLPATREHFLNSLQEIQSSPCARSTSTWERLHGLPQPYLYENVFIPSSDTS